MICQFFYFCGEEMYCKCNHELVNCLAIEESCEYKLDKQCYEDDLEDERRGLI